MKRLSLIRYVQDLEVLKRKETKAPPQRYGYTTVQHFDSKPRVWVCSGGGSFAPIRPLLDEERNSAVLKGVSGALGKISAIKIKCS